MNRKPTKENTAGQGGEFSKANIDKANHSKSDPLVGWHELANSARNRQQKSGWKRGSK